MQWKENSQLKKINPDKLVKLFTNYIQLIINLFLVSLALLLAILLLKETANLIDITFNTNYNKDFYREFLESLLTFFIYFEFILMIIKYFKEHYHFPLRFFMYIGITATIRVIIVDHENGLETLYFSLSILILVVGYGIIRFLSMLKEKWGLKNDWIFSLSYFDNDSQSSCDWWVFVLQCK